MKTEIEDIIDCILKWDSDNSSDFVNSEYFKVIQRDLKKAIAEQPKTPQPAGWECPRCHQIHSYLKMSCDCPPQTFTSTTYGKTDPEADIPKHSTSWRDFTMTDPDHSEDVLDMVEQPREQDKDMIKYILDIDFMTTTEFCKAYNVPEPVFTGEVQSSARQFLQIDAIKHRMFVEKAKELNKQSIEPKPDTSQDEQPKSAEERQSLMEKYGVTEDDVEAAMKIYFKGKYDLPSCWDDCKRLSHGTIEDCQKCADRPDGYSMYKKTDSINNPIDLRKKLKVKCMSCEKEVNYSEGIFTCSDCSK